MCVSVSLYIFLYLLLFFVLNINSWRLRILFALYKITIFIAFTAPKNQPTEVSVKVLDSDSIKVEFRGVSTDYTEEPLQGYMVSEM